MLKLVISILIVPLFLNAQVPEGFKKLDINEKLKKEMKDAGSNQHSIQSNFVQLKHMSFLETDLQSQGKFWFEKPGKIRWEYQVPFKYTVVINAGKLSIISNANQSEFDLANSEIFNQVNTLLTASVTGNIFDVEGFSVEIYENPNKYYFVLKPANEALSGILKKIEIWYRKKDKSVGKIKLHESGADYSQITFTDTKLNEEIPDNIFSL